MAKVSDRQPMIDGRQVRMWPGTATDDPEANGSVTACRLECAKEAAETNDLVLADDVEDHAEPEDHAAGCDGCGFPNPAAMDLETTESLTPKQRAWIESYDESEEN